MTRFLQRLNQKLEVLYEKYTVKTVKKKKKKVQMQIHLFSKIRITNYTIIFIQNKIQGTLHH